jgi:hypothetical protein
VPQLNVITCCAQWVWQPPWMKQRNEEIAQLQNALQQFIKVWCTYQRWYARGFEGRIDLENSYVNKLISKALDTKFLGIHVDSTLSWKIHIEQIINKLSSACYAMRSIKPLMSQETLKIVYYAYFHSIVNYGLIFWGNSSHSVTIFKIQKNIIRIITGCRSRDSCRDLFKNIKILSLQSQYIL